MSAEHTFKFGEYTLRPACMVDMGSAVKWTMQDVDHAERTRPEFWLEQKIDRDSYMLEDREGPIFFFKLHRIGLHAVEMHTQFPPQEDQHMRERVQHGIVHGFGWLEQQLQINSKIHEIFFDTRHEPLRAFAERRLGFSPANVPALPDEKHPSTRLSKKIGGQ